MGTRIETKIGTKIATLVGALALTACLIPQGRGGRTTTKEGWVRTTLDNGLRVIVLEDRSAPVVALNLWVRTGSADETDAEAGMAHVFEHMLFKGTERRAVGEIARTVEAAGGNVNAFTSFDMTVYHITMAREDAATGIDVLADAALHSTFDPGELAKEMEVVVEEIRRGQDSPGRVLSEAVFSTAYERHPYHRPVIGTTESVRSFTRDQLLDFHHRWYTPDNMTFVAVGDLDAQTTLEQIRTAFAGAERRGAPSHEREPEPPRDSPRGTVVRRPFSKPMLGIAFPITSFAHPDSAYLDLLAGILGGGDSSRLYRNVKDREQLVHTISAGAYTPLDPGLFVIDASLDGDRIETALGAIAREIRHLQTVGPSTAELDRARVNLLASEVREKETMQGQARKIGYYETLAGGIEKEAEYLERIRRATADDVSRVAREYLVPERLTAAVLLPEAERPELESEALVAAYRAGQRVAGEIAREPLGENVWRYSLSNGLRVIVKRNPSVPLVSLQLSFLGGMLAEDEKTQGISSFLAEMLQRGTELRSAAQIAAEVEGIAGSLEGFSGRNSFGITASFLAESLEPGLELLADVVLHPSFSEDEIEKLRTETLAAIERKEDNLGGKSFELFARALYAGHPYSYPMLGEKESVARFGRDALERYYRRYAVPTNGVLAVVGDVDPDEVVQAIASHLQDWDGGAASLPERPRVAAPTRPRTEQIEKNRQQTHVVFGFLGLPIDDPDVEALEVLTQILSGQGGRLFVELRDRRSLAYSVGAFSIEGVDPGSVAVYIACAPEKLDEAIEGIRSELRRILEQEISADELDRARSYLAGTHAVSLQRFGSQARILSLEEIYGLGATHHLGYANRVEAVTLEDVKRVARRLIRLDAPVIAVIR